MTTTELTADLEAGYESFLSARPEALVWHSLGFRDVLLEVLDCEPRYLVEQTNRKVSGVMPLMEKDGILNSLPYFGSMGGPVGGGRGLRMAYSERVEEARAGTVISNPFASHPVRFNQLVRREAQWSPLPATQLSLPSMKKVRLDLNRASRAGVEVVRDQGAMRELELVHRQNMKAVGAPPRTPGFFAAVERHLDYELWIAAIRGQLAAALLVLHYGQDDRVRGPGDRASLSPGQPAGGADLAGHARSLPSRLYAVELGRLDDSRRGRRQVQAQVGRPRRHVSLLLSGE